MTVPPVLHVGRTTLIGADEIAAYVARMHALFGKFEETPA